MRYIEFAVYTTDAGIEPVVGALSRVGLVQVSIEESRETIEAHILTMRPYWDFADVAALASPMGPCVKAYIADLPENEGLLVSAHEAVERLRGMNLGFDCGPLTVAERKLHEEDWSSSWKQYYKPLPVGEKLLICPSWEEAPTGGRHVVYMDPGMVFGTGAHDTTRMCLSLLEKAMKPGDRVLDVGCGSGILGIAALHLGAADCTLVDIDPVASRVVQENFRMNGYGKCNILIGNILEDEGLQRRVEGQYDVVCANIVADVVIALCSQAYRYVRPGGHFLCSGIIDDRAQEVQGALLSNGFTVKEKIRAAEASDKDPMETGWVAFHAVRA